MSEVRRRGLRGRARATRAGFALGAVGALGVVVVLFALARAPLGPALADAVADLVATDAPGSGLDPARRALLLDMARAHAAAARAAGNLMPARHAHDSATFEELRAALAGDYDSIEGDVGLDGTIAVVRHDVGDPVEFTLDEWLEVVALAEFRTIKLDLKRDRVGPIAQALLASIERHRISAGRLKLNADVFEGPGAHSGMSLPERLYVDLAVRLEPADLEYMVRAFPKATVSVSAVLGREPGAPPYQPVDIERFRELVRQMRAAGAADVVVVARWDLLTPELVEAMAAIDARVDVWNSFSAAPLPADPEAEAAALRARYGAALGVVDLRR